MTLWRCILWYLKGTASFCLELGRRNHWVVVYHSSWILPLPICDRLTRKGERSLSWGDSRCNHRASSIKPAWILWINHLELNAASSLVYHTETGFNSPTCIDCKQRKKIQEQRVTYLQCAYTQGRLSRDHRRNTHFGLWLNSMCPDLYNHQFKASYNKTSSCSSSMYNLPTTKERKYR